jgi:hypothetical protein
LPLCKKLLKHNKKKKKKKKKTAPRFVPESNQKYPSERDFIDN